MLADRYAALAFFDGTPAAEAIDVAARLFPLFAPAAEADRPAPADARHRSRRGPASRMPAPGTAAWPRWARALLALAGLAVVGRARGARMIVVRGPPPRARGRDRSSTASRSRWHAAKPSRWSARTAPGKTSVLRCLLGLVPVHRAGDDRRLRRRARAGRRAALVGYVPQKAAFGDARAGEVLAFVARVRGRRPARRRGAAARRRPRGTRGRAGADVLGRHAAAAGARRRAARRPAGPAPRRADARASIGRQAGHVPRDRRRACGGDGHTLLLASHRRRGG